MRKITLMSIALIAALTVVSCKPSDESTYKKAYEKAKNQELYTQDTDPVEVAPVAPRKETTTHTTTRPTTTTKTSSENVAVRQERLTVVSGGALKSYNVVCGSFKSQENASKLCNALVEKGFKAQVAQNPDTGMYRVIASSHDSKEAAISSRDQLRGNYPDAWLLYRTY